LGDYVDETLASGGFSAVHPGVSESQYSQSEGVGGSLGRVLVE